MDAWSTPDTTAAAVGVGVVGVVGDAGGGVALLGLRNKLLHGLSCQHVSSRQRHQHTPIVMSSRSHRLNLAARRSTALLLPTRSLGDCCEPGVDACDAGCMVPAPKARCAWS